MIIGEFVFENIVTKEALFASLSRRIRRPHESEISRQADFPVWLVMQMAVDAALETIPDLKNTGNWRVISWQFDGHVG